MYILCAFYERVNGWIWMKVVLGACSCPTTIFWGRVFAFGSSVTIIPSNLPWCQGNSNVKRNGTRQMDQWHMSRNYFGKLRHFNGNNSPPKSPWTCKQGCCWASDGVGITNWSSILATKKLNMSHLYCAIETFHRIEPSSVVVFRGQPNFKIRTSKL